MKKIPVSTMVLEMPPPSSWVCHCGTPYAGGYVIVGHPKQVAMALWDTLYRRLCHVGTPYVGGYVFMKRPI